MDRGKGREHDDRVELANAIRALMLLRGLSQEALEAASGIDQARISRILNHHALPTFDNLRRIEAACDQMAGYLLGAAGLVTVDGVRRGAKARSIRTDIGR